MGEGTSTNCRSWEEEIYWSHFQCIHFSQFLNAGFDRRMAIPEKFTRKMSKKLPEVVSLKGPSGATWKIGLTTNENTMFFSDGWEEFVKDHLLEENDFLVFKYNGESQFDVLMFDGRNMCEKAASYFVKKYEHGGHESGFRVKRTTGESFIDVSIDSHDDVVGSQQNRNADNDDGTVPVGKPKKSKVTLRRSWRYNNSLQSAGSGEPSSDSEELDVKPDVGQMSGTNKPMRGALRKHNLQLARAAVSNDGFIVVLKPSHLEDKYYLNLPVVWMKKYLSLEKQDVILCFEGKTWRIRFLCRKLRQSGYRGAFSGGWRKFAIDNKLHKSDVCVFEPGSKLNNLVVLDVHVFRATQ